MRRTWPVQEAKERFSEFLEASLTEGPQIVTKRGVETAALVSIDQWRRMDGRRCPTSRRCSSLQRRVRDTGPTACATSASPMSPILTLSVLWYRSPYRGRSPASRRTLVVVQLDRNGCYSGSRGITFTLGGDGSEILRDPPQGGRTGRIDAVGKDRTGGGLPPAECVDPAVGRPGRTRTWTTRHGDRGAGGGHSTDGREGA